MPMESLMGGAFPNMFARQDVDNALRQGPEMMAAKEMAPDNPEVWEKIANFLIMKARSTMRMPGSNFGALPNPFAQR